MAVLRSVVQTDPHPGTAPDRRFRHKDAGKAPETGTQAAAFLTLLRLTALECRAAAYSDLFRACALLSIDRRSSARLHAEALVKCLPQALGTAPVFFRPGVAELSFDEAWILEITAAVTRGDEASLDFLIRSRVAPETRRSVAFLLRGVVERAAG